jgi:DNA polymerase III delta prime subunit
MSVDISLMYSRNNISILISCPEKTDLSQLVINFLQQKKLLAIQTSTENNPDLHFINTPEENITIEAVRQLNQDVLLKPYTAPTSIFVIYNIDQGSVAAQNALLKLIEEPPVHAQLVLTTCTLANVLTTIQSRCQTEEMKSSTSPEKEDFSEIYKHLQNASHSDVITLSEKYKERPDALEFVKGLLEWLHQQTPSAVTTQQLEQLVHTEDMLRKNVNVRLAFEDCFFNFDFDTV